MGRPAGRTDYQRRLKAFEMFAAGVKKVEIARELGVTRPAVGAWSVTDKWAERMTNIVNRAEEALNHGEGNEVAHTLKVLRGQLTKRVDELETMCGSSTAPAIRLQAIKMWLTLAGVTRGIPNPAAPTTPRSLELIEDLIHDTVQEGLEAPASDYQPLYQPEDPKADNRGDSRGNERGAGPGRSSVEQEPGVPDPDPDGNILPWGQNPVGEAGGKSRPDEAEWTDAEGDEAEDPAI